MGEIVNKKIIIDYDGERTPPLIIAYNREMEPDPVQDMALTCEALCTMIHTANKLGLKEDFKSIKDCIDHLKKGFIDETYRVGVKDELDTTR